ncbi:peptidoglycan DD-metalloendopeptidase family protein [Caldicellulosiruptoraceae bacterium PP1]
MANKTKSSSSTKTATIKNEQSAKFIPNKSNTTNVSVKEKRELSIDKIDENRKIIHDKNSKDIIKKPSDKIVKELFNINDTKKNKNLSKKKDALNVIKEMQKINSNINTKKALPPKTKKSFQLIFENTYRYFVGIKEFCENEREKILKIKIFSTLVLLLTTLLIISKVSSNIYPDIHLNSPVAIAVGGKTIGVIENQKEAKNILYEIYQDIYRKYGVDSYKFANTIQFKEVTGDYSISDKEQIKNKILENGKPLIKRFVITINNKAYFAFDNIDTPKKILVDLKKLYYKNNADKATFLENVEIKEAFISPDVKITDEKTALEKIRFGKDKILEYEIKEGDTLWDLSRKYDVSVDDIFASNPGLSENIKPGQKIKLTKASPMINVVYEKTINYEDTLPKPVKVVKTSSMYTTQSVVKQEGKDGKAKIEAKIVLLNGLEYDRKILKQEIIQKPVERVLYVGTKKPPLYMATGRFSYPLWGTLSSRFGYRGREFHEGIDLAVPWGTSVYASDGGVIEFTGWSGGYGKLIIINHKNGYQTYYGHLSSIYVTPGQKVVKGQIIGKSGSTGRSTGPHLHFEVRKNGVPQNPLRYLQ